MTYMEQFPTAESYVLHRKWNERNEAKLQKRKAGNANEPHRKSHSLR